MAVNQECPACKRIQAVRHKRCRGCGEDMDKAKRSGRITYFINYRVPGDRRLRWQRIGSSYSEARDADGKRRVQRREHRIFDMIPESDISFTDLFEWYGGLESSKALAMAGIRRIHFDIFGAEFGPVYVRDLSASALANFQAKLRNRGLSASYVDQIVGSARAAIMKAIDDDKISGDCARPFRKLKKALKSKRSNARDLIFSHGEYLALMATAPQHTAAVIAMGYWTGMRLDEILTLTWDQVKLSGSGAPCIELEASATKDDEPRRVPIFKPLLEVLRKLPRGIKYNEVILYRGEPLTDIRAGFKRAMEDAGVAYGRRVAGGKTFHDLRHTFNTNMRRAGVPEGVIMKITGHSTREMFDRYNQVDAGDAAAAGEAFMDYIGGEIFEKGAGAI